MGHRQRTARRISAAAANALIAEASAPEHLADEVLEGLAARTAGIQLQPRRRRGRPRKADLRPPVSSVWARSLKAASAKRKREQQPMARSSGPAVGACLRLAGDAAANCLEATGLVGITAGTLLHLKPLAGPAYSLEPLSRCAQVQQAMKRKHAMCAVLHAADPELSSTPRGSPYLQVIAGLPRCTRAVLHSVHHTAAPLQGPVKAVAPWQP